MLGLLALMTATAATSDLRDLCADRPGLGTPACTVDRGHVQAEIGLADWTRDRQAGSRTDTWIYGDTSLRYGVSDTTELRMGWTALGHERDRSGGMAESATRIGDVTLGLKQNLRNPDGSGLSIALLPEVTLPAGRQPIGQTTWSASLVLPVDYQLSDAIDLQFTPQIDAAADEGAKRRHLAYSAVVGVDIDLTDALAIDLEVQAKRDRDPGGHRTMAFAGAALDYVIRERTQLDVGAIAGLNRNSPDLELYFGVTRKF